MPITLGVRRKSGAEFLSRPAKPPPPDAVWRQDDFVCQFCGFRAEKFQRTVQGAWAGHERAALTACIFCEQCFTLENVGIVGSGYLVWLPEMSQAELHHLCRAIYVARAQGRQELLASRAQAALDSLLSRRAEAKKRLGSDEPLLLGTALLENLSAEEYQAREKKLAGIRLLPLNRRLGATRGEGGATDQFPAILDYWMSPRGPFAGAPVDGWIRQFPAAS